MTNSCNSMYINIYNMFPSSMSVYKVGFYDVNPLSNKSLSCWRWCRENKSRPNQIKLYSILSLQEYQNSFSYPFVLMKFFYCTHNAGEQSSIPDLICSHKPEQTRLVGWKALQIKLQHWLLGQLSLKSVSLCAP